MNSPEATLSDLRLDARRVLRAPPTFTVSQWADENRRLSSESSPEPFQWRTARAEYQRGIMDAFSDPRNRRVVVMSSSQVGKTSIIENIVGFHIDQDPSPILIVQPTLDMGETMSKDRLAPMLRDTPCLRGKVADVRARDSGNTLLHKNFVGGHLTIAGANSPSSLAGRPIRVLLCDDLDRFPVSAGPEGNPTRLAIKRTNNFWNRRIGLFSTPTDEDVGIDAEFAGSDQRRFYVPCVHCEYPQVLAWPQVKWSTDNASDARYACASCGALWSEVERDRAVAAGEWRATAPFRGIAGFHVNELYSPWRKFSDVAVDFLESKDDPEKLKVWTNTALGEPWKQETQGISADALEQGDAAYAIGEIPPGALVLTLGVDTQGDRLALQLVGWGRRGEQWTIDYLELPGDPALDSTWDRLTEYRCQRWAHPAGGVIGVSMTAIDSGGMCALEVVGYARKFLEESMLTGEGVMAIKGASTALATVLRPRASNVDYKADGKVFKRGGKLWFIDTNIAKDSLMSRLRAEETRRRIHFAKGLGIEFFRQLTAEIKDKTTRKWVNPKQLRNEALDTLVYAYAATFHPWLRLDVAGESKWAKFEARAAASEKTDAEVAGSAQGAPAPEGKGYEPSKRQSFMRGPISRPAGFVTRYRGP